MLIFCSEGSGAHGKAASFVGDRPVEREQLEKRKNMICDLMREESYVPMRERELRAFLQVKDEDREDFKQALAELVKEDRIRINRRGRYTTPEEELISGVFTANPKGFGFVEAEGRTEDIYIQESSVHGAFHGDSVQVRILPGRHGKRTEGEIVRILARGTRTLVGTYESSRNFGFVIPDNDRFGTDIFIPGGCAGKAADGCKVVVELTDYGDGKKRPEGKVTTVIGHRDDPGVEIMSIVMGYGLPVEFPEKVLNQAERVGKPVSEADCAGRRDLRKLQMVTIDGEDAKDLDDAVSLVKEKDTYRLGVHIADVSNYVQENSALDREAFKRGTSVYLADRVIPMLPHTLSNGICSLNEGEDRLALSCLMTIDHRGEVVDYEIVESVICVDRRMSYPVVARLLGEDRENGTPASDEDRENGMPASGGGRENGAPASDGAWEGGMSASFVEREGGDKDGGAQLREAYRELMPMFRGMEELAAILRKKRKKRGSIDFDFPEAKILLDKDGHPLEIMPYERNVATDIIEEFMLAANETVAQHFYWQELPFVYRTHENPDPDKIRRLGTFIHNFGYRLKWNSEEIHPKEIQKLIARVADTPEEALIGRLALRSMKQAKYTTECTGHFGLACEFYCHFTSPIRRYPDLQIHRIIKESLRGRLQEGRIEHYRAILPKVAKECSALERRADEAERETDKQKKVEYMESRIGKIYEGVISGVTNWGIYVELPNTVEGLVHVSKLLGDYFYYNESAYELVGERSGLTYKLGQTIRVAVAGVDPAARTIDFSIPMEDEYGA